MCLKVILSILSDNFWNLNPTLFIKKENYNSITVRNLIILPRQRRQIMKRTWLLSYREELHPTNTMGKGFLTFENLLVLNNVIGWKFYRRLLWVKVYKYWHMKRRQWFQLCTMCILYHFHYHTVKTLM